MSKRVKNIIVSQIDEFKEVLATNLTKNNIQYLQIDNEFHYLNKIFRFYDIDIKEDIDFITMELLDDKTDNDIINILTPYHLYFAPHDKKTGFINLFNNYNIFTDINSYIEELDSIPYYDNYTPKVNCKK